MPLVGLASFSNSRIAPRHATTVADTKEVILPADGLNHLIMPADQNRTYMTITNQSAVAVPPVVGDAFRYSYSDRADMATEGMEIGPKVGADLESPEELWALNMSLNPIVILVDFGVG